MPVVKYENDPALDLTNVLEPKQSYIAKESGIDNFFLANSLDFSDLFLSNQGRGVLTGLPVATVETKYFIGTGDLGSVFAPIGCAPGKNLLWSNNQLTTFNILTSSLTVVNANNGTTFVPKKVFFIAQGYGGDSGYNGLSSRGAIPFYGGGGAGGGGAGGLIWGFIDLTNVYRIGASSGTNTINFYNSGGTIIATITVPKGGDGGNGSTGTGGIAGVGGVAGTITLDSLGIFTVIGSSSGQNGKAGGNQAVAAVNNAYAQGALLSRSMFNGSLYIPTFAGTFLGGATGTNSSITIGYDTYIIYAGGGGAPGGLGINFGIDSSNGTLGGNHDGTGIVPVSNTTAYASGAGGGGAPGGSNTTATNYKRVNGTGYKFPQLALYYG